MRVIDPGHVYALAQLDGDAEEILNFVKREGAGYPGNIGSHPGTNIQEALRALIDRVRYLDRQIPDATNGHVIEALRCALYWLEVRAAERHGRPRPEYGGDIETRPACATCGHISCAGHPGRAA